MDSVSQFVLGSAVTVAAVGGRVPAWQAVLGGGLLGTLPDLDVLIGHGDAIQDMTRHRAESHALLWQTLAAPVVAFAIAVLRGERARFARGLLAVWATFVSHALLDAMTIYGTQLWLPFTDRPVSIGSLFVVDPLYTLPLLVAAVAMLVTRGSRRGRRWNAAGLALSTLYAGWSLVAMQFATANARRSLDAAGLQAERLIVTPAPLQTLVWRAIAIADDGSRAYEGYTSLLDDDAPIRFHAIDRRPQLLEQATALPSVARLRWFADDFVKAHRDGADLLVSDLRMGAEPDYVFTFRVATIGVGDVLTPSAEIVRRPFDAELGAGLDWLWRRALGERVEPPR